MSLQDLEDDSLQFDLSAETLEELFEWYQAAWDITQRKISKEYNRQHEVSASAKISPKDTAVCALAGKMKLVTLLHFWLPVPQYSQY